MTGPRGTPLDLQAVEALTVDEIRRRLAVYAISIDGFDSLNAGQQELLTDCATWMHDKYEPLLAHCRALRAALNDATQGFELGEFENTLEGDVVITQTVWKRLCASWERAAAVLAQGRDGP